MTESEARRNEQLRVGNPGNRGGTGRPRNEVRQKYLQGSDDAADRIQAMVRNESVMPIVNGKGEVTGTRPPNFAEWSWAAEMCGKLGLGTKIETEHSGEIDVNHLSSGERARRAAELLNAARARRDGSAADGGDEEL